ncbi:hypothetical protein KY334_07810 [Candidatus Woesearchaeota archaeon]|nr:hypothetical protein [Candidatus Woesearchaeota archaeon]
MKNQKKNGKNLRNNIIFFLVIVSLLLSAYLISYSLSIVDVKEINMVVEVSDTGIGFNNNASELNFGVLGVGNSAKKTIILTQSEYDELKVKIDISGDIAQFIRVPSELTLKDELEIGFVASIPGSAKTGIYKGKAKIIMIK